MDLNFKGKFTEIYKENITRAGAAELFEWLCGTDFFTAPASAKYHSAFEGGLVYHCLSVFDVMMEKHFEPDDNKESFAICALLHDLCKVQFYKVAYRNVKNEETARWDRVPFYQIEDTFPFGHGEKSVYLIERFMKLKPSEAVAIRWHMGGFDNASKGGDYSISGAYEKYPLAVKLHLSDLESTYLRENKK